MRWVTNIHWGGAGRLAHDQLSERIHVQSLSFGGVRSLIAATLGEAVASEEFTQTLCDRTEGNPFFAHEVMRTLIESSDVLQHDGAWDLSAIKRLEIPESVRTGIAQRFHRLSPTAQGVLHEASILGQTFAFDDLQAMNGHSEAEIEDALEEGLGARLLDEVDGDHVGFHHALIYEALYHDSRRINDSACTAEPARPSNGCRSACEYAAPPTWPIISALLAKARAPCPICCLPVIRPRQFMRTARRRVSIVPRRKWRATGRSGARSCRAGEAGGVQLFVARLEDANEAYDQASHAYREIGDILGLRRVTAGLARTVAYLGDVVRGRALLQALLDSRPSGEPATSVAEIYFELAWLCSDPVERLAACERAAEIARANSDNHTWP